MYKLYEVNYSKKRKVILQGSLSQIDKFLLTFECGRCYGNTALFVQTMKESGKVSSMCYNIVLQKENGAVIPMFVGEEEKAILISLLSFLNQQLEYQDEKSKEKPDELILNEQYLIRNKVLYRWINDIVKSFSNINGQILLEQANEFGIFSKADYERIDSYISMISYKDPTYKNTSPRLQEDYIKSSKNLFKTYCYSVFRGLLTGSTELKNEISNNYRQNGDIDYDKRNLLINEENFTEEECQKSYYL